MATAHSGRCSICGQWISIADNNTGRECTSCSNPICGPCGSKGYYQCGGDRCATEEARRERYRNDNNR